MPFKQRTKLSQVMDAEGNKIPGMFVECEDTHRKWRATIIWICAFTLIVFFALWGNRQNSVHVGDLQKTNCNLRNFLISSEKFRLRTAREHDTEAKHLTGEAK